NKLGPILWQFAPTKQFDEADLAAFLKLLPAEIGGQRLRHVIEARHRSFDSPAFVDLLREHGAALARVDDAHYPEFAETTADFLYLRLRRSTEDEPTGYTPDALDQHHAQFHQHAPHEVFLRLIAQTFADDLVQRLPGLRQ